MSHRNDPSNDIFCAAKILKKLILLLFHRLFINFSHYTHKYKMGTDVPMPDLSHLTEEERKTIMQVMNRHKEEEKAEIQMYKSVEKQLGLYLKQGRNRTVNRIMSYRMLMS